MPRGPLPNPRRVRRNTPTIPTTNLPVSGYQGPIPPLPEWIPLGNAGTCWWMWAWTTPQAAAWSAGHAVAIARRAVLEDVLVGAEEPKDKLAVAREARELDDRLGLTPKGMAQLRWEIVADTPAEDEIVEDEVAQRRASRRERLTGS